MYDNSIINTTKKQAGAGIILKPNLDMIQKRDKKARDSEPMVRLKDTVEDIAVKKLIPKDAEGDIITNNGS